MGAIEKAQTIDDPFFQDDRLHWRDARIERDDIVRSHQQRIDV